MAVGNGAADRLGQSVEPRLADGGLEEQMSVQEFCERHGLHQKFLPLEYRQTDPFELLATIRDNLAELRPTASSVRINDLLGDAGTASGWVRSFLLALGSWPSPKDVAQGDRWVNPDYVHADALGSIADDEAAREAHVRTCARLGTLDLPDLAPRFATTEQGLARWVRHRDIPWRELRREAIARLARTLYTALAWGHDRSKVLGVWPQPEPQVRCWVAEYAAATEFEPPAEPSDDPKLLMGVKR